MHTGPAKACYVPGVALNCSSHVRAIPLISALASDMSIGRVGELNPGPCRAAVPIAL